MKLKTTTNNAVRILVACAQSDADRVKSVELAELLDLTEQNTLKIIYILSQAGFLANTRGRHGGVSLAIPPDEIYIGDVVRKVEADVAGNSAASLKSFDHLVEDAFDAFLSVLDGQTLSDIARRPQKAAAKRKKQSKSTHGKKSPRAKTNKLAGRGI